MSDSWQCPVCKRYYHASAFHAQPWCGSPDEWYHRLCMQCQETGRAFWARQLEDYFKREVTLGRLRAA